MASIQEIIDMPNRAKIDSIEGTIKVAKEKQPAKGGFSKFQQWCLIAEGDHSVPIVFYDVDEMRKGEAIKVEGKMGKNGMTGVQMNKWNKQDGSESAQVQVYNNARISKAGGAVSEQAGTSPLVGPGRQSREPIDLIELFDYYLDFLCKPSYELSLDSKADLAQKMAVTAFIQGCKVAKDPTPEVNVAEVKGLVTDSFDDIPF